MFGFEHSATLETLKKGLDGLERRQNLFANNLANKDTPGYLARELDFERVMNAQSQKDLSYEPDLKALTTHDMHMIEAVTEADIWTSAVTTKPEPPDLQEQMVGLSQNSLQYSAAAQLMGQQFQRYRQAITEGSR